MLDPLLTQILLGIALLFLLIVRSLGHSRTKGKPAMEDAGERRTTAVKPRKRVVVVGILAELFFPLLILNIFLYPTVAPYLLLLDLGISSSIVQIGGLCLSMVGAGIMLVAIRTLGKNWADAEATRQGIYLSTEHQLVQTGIYARIRHPIYLGSLCLMTGCAILSLEGIMLLFFPVIAAWAYLQAGFEEQALHEHFGKEYEEYMQRTGRLLPRRRGVE